MNIITFFISIISFFMALKVYIQNTLSARFNLGIKHEQEMIDDEKAKALFIKFSFINHSSKPLTITNIKVLDYRKKPFSNYGGYEYGVEAGDSIPFNLKVRHCFWNDVIKEYPYTSAVFPLTLSPYLSASEYFAFYFEKQDAHIVKNKDTIFFLVQTTAGTLYIKAYPGSYFSELNKETNQFELHPFKFYRKTDCLKNSLFNYSDKIQKRKNNSNSRNNKSKK